MSSYSDFIEDKNREAIAAVAAGDPDAVAKAIAYAVVEGGETLNETMRAMNEATLRQQGQ
ncbi:hypothetical protein ACIQPQ_31340 [Streptomyces sp. NPDC091281]|uniref:hypothetical protein n=1 Tax=Streptomyces sp. NPDC091281 TaxID=3365985 RepID=UPI0037F82C01